MKREPAPSTGSIGKNQETEHLDGSMDSKVERISIVPNAKQHYYIMHRIYSHLSDLVCPFATSIPDETPSAKTEDHFKSY